MYIQGMSGTATRGNPSYDNPDSPSPNLHGGIPVVKTEYIHIHKGLWLVYTFTCMLVSYTAALPVRGGTSGNYLVLRLKIQLSNERLDQ